MAEKLPQTLNAQFAGLSRLTAHRQFGLILGLAVVLALGTATVMWATTPNFVEIMSAESQASFADATRVLGRADIESKVHPRTRALMVPATRVADAETALMAENLFGDGSTGYELLDEQNSIGQSHLSELANHRRALQGELQRTISKIAGVSSATVYIASGNDTGFLRQRDPVTASVVLAVRREPLTDLEVAGIAQTVANSVPGLMPARVSITDQTGRQLNKLSEDESSTARSEQLGFKRDLEAEYGNRIREILTPAVGLNKVQVVVEANVDFTRTETASETFGSDQPAAVLSESVREDESSASSVGGVPGALTNQPPAAAAVVDDANGIVDGATTSDAGPRSVSRSSTRNFENDRVVSHVQAGGYALQNLSISVLVDNREVVDEDGEVTSVPRTEQELERYAALVRNAVGYSEARGDSLTIENDEFHTLPALEPAPPEPIWKQAWVMQLARYAAGGLGVLLLVLLVVRPVLKSLAAIPPAPRMAPLPAGAQGVAASAAMGELMPAPPNTAAADAALGRARKVANEDPRLVAQVVKRWIADDGK